MIDKKFKKGFSLVEIVIVIGLTLSIFMAVFYFGQSIFSWNSSSQQNLTAQTSARRVLKTMVAELRSASPSSLGSYPIALASTTSVTFFSNIDGDSLKEQIRYFLQGTSLKRGVVEPSGTPLTYNQGNETVTTLITDINNGVTPIFEYFNNTYTGTSSPLVQPVSITQVRLIRMNLIIQKLAVKPIVSVTATSQVFLRNLKDNL